MGRTLPPLERWWRSAYILSRGVRYLFSYTNIPLRLGQAIRPSLISQSLFSNIIFLIKIEKKKKANTKGKTTKIVWKRNLSPIASSSSLPPLKFLQKNYINPLCNFLGIEKLQISKNYQGGKHSEIKTSLLQI